LKDILNRIRVTASLEIARFYRGDYIAAWTVTQPMASRNVINPD
jgi:hypothetical protein